MDLASYNEDYRNPEQILMKNKRNEQKMAKTVVFLTKKQATVLCLITDQRSGYFRMGFTTFLSINKVHAI